MKNIKKDIIELLNKIKLLDKKVIIIFLSFSVLETISWYYSSRKFFILNILPKYFIESIYSDLYEFLYWFLSDFFLYGVITLLIVRFYLREKPKDYGLTFGDYKTGFFYSLLFLIIMIPILWFVSSFPEFSAKYPHLQMAKYDYKLFLYYEIGMMLYLYAWEFVFRGYMLFGLYPKFGYYAVLIQMVPFVILHNGKPPLETFSAILGGITLGILALKTNSFLYGFFVHFGIMFLIDLFSILRFRTESYGIDVRSFLKVIGVI